jgi:hypothetical protein
MATMRTLLMLCAALLASHGAGAVGTSCQSSGQVCGAATKCCTGLYCDTLTGAASAGVCKK